VPELVRCRGLVLELVRGFDDDERRAGDEVMGLEEAIDGSFGYEVILGVGEACRQFAWR
jgi:hypothetical protein